jgi:hypothetical protein
MRPSRKTRRNRRLGALALSVLALAASAGLSFSNESVDADTEPLVLRIAHTDPPLDQGGVYVDVSILVRGTKSARVPTLLLLGGNLSIEVRSASGVRLPFRGPKMKLKPLSGDQFTLLSPSHFVGRVVNLAEAFDLSTDGRYAVRATFSNQDGGETHEIHAWTGTLVSRELILDVRH